MSEAIRQLWELSQLDERARLNRELERISFYEERHCGTWNDRARAREIKRRLADIEFAEKKAGRR